MQVEVFLQYIVALVHYAYVVSTGCTVCVLVNILVSVLVCTVNAAIDTCVHTVQVHSSVMLV
jgi:hypothetical protein